MEHAECAEFATCPLALVALESGIERVGKLSDDGDGPSRARETTLFGAINGLLEDEKGEEDRKRCGDDGRFFVTEEFVA